MGARVLVVDAANVVGSRPDGWWRDRAGAATRLLHRLLPLCGTSVDLPDGAGPPVRVDRVVVVLEGAARAAVLPAGAAESGLAVVLADADGDAEVVRQATAAGERGAAPLVVTADRGLRARLPEVAEVAGPSWLWSLLDGLGDTSCRT